ncbi:MAG: hypothetical protein AMXMBFR53_26740 [Gemmatimonadota bacterium]
MPVRHDPSLGSAPGGAPPGRLGGAEPPVVRAGVATSRPFLLEGERVAVAGRERQGEHAVWVDGVEVLANLATDAGACVNVVAGPSTLRRELLGAFATVLEAALAAPALPMAAVQWTSPPGGRWPGALQLAFSVLPASRDLRYHAHGGMLRAVPVGDEGRTVVVRVHPEPEAWTVVEGPAGGLGVRASVRGPAPVTLVVAAGTPDTAERALAAAPHLAAHEIRAAADADPANLETLCTATGVPDLDQGVIWAAARVRAGVGRPPIPGAEAAFWSGMGALALGDDAAARRALSSMEAAEGEVAWSLGGPAPAPALAVLLAARVTLLTGDPGPARGTLAGVSPGATGRLREASGTEAWSVWSLALTTLADALRHAASDGEIGALREAAALPAGRGGVRLPMVGGGGAPGGAGLLRGLLAGTLAGPAPAHTAGDTPLGCWLRMAAGDPDGGYAAWRGLLGRGLSGEPHGRGCWDPPAGPPGPAPGAALLLCGLAQGLLGLDADAPSGRLRVAPALPRHLTAFTGRGIRVGESRLTLRYEREGRLHRLTLEPTRGRVPPLVILEPSLPCAGVAATRVDGAPADLDTRGEGARTRVRVQIPLDGVRTLEVEEAG